MKNNQMILKAELLTSKLGYTSIVAKEKATENGEIPVAKLTASNETLHDEIFKCYDFIKNNCQNLNNLVSAKKVEKTANNSVPNNLQYLKFYIALLEARFLNEKFRNEQTAEALEKLDASKAFLVKTMQEARLVE